MHQFIFRGEDSGQNKKSQQMETKKYDPIQMGRSCLAAMEQRIGLSVIDSQEILQKGI